jgi:hypothetical protein
MAISSPATPSIHRRSVTGHSRRHRNQLPCGFVGIEVGQGNMTLLQLDDGKISLCDCDAMCATTMRTQFSDTWPTDRLGHLPSAYLSVQNRDSDHMRCQGGPRILSHSEGVRHRRDRHHARLRRICRVHGPTANRRMEEREAADPVRSRSNIVALSCRPSQSKSAPPTFGRSCQVLSIADDNADLVILSE